VDCPARSDCGGAHIILVPEIPFTLENACDAVGAREPRGKRFGLIVVAGGVKLPEKDPEGKPIPNAGPGSVRNSIGYRFAKCFTRKFVSPYLATFQRGGSPTALPHPTCLPDRSSGAWFA